MTDSTALECIDVSVDYGSFRAVDGVSFSLKAGQITALLGPVDAGSRLCCAQLRVLNALKKAISNGVESQFFALRRIGAVLA